MMIGSQKQAEADWPQHCFAAKSGYKDPYALLNVA